MTQTSLGENVGADIDNEDRLRVLGVIDKLRELGVSDDISLPQIAVIGDQSSGKSSLLEGMTGLSFPIASELCTRFATQIVLRRAPRSESCARVSIILGPSAKRNKTQIAELEKFNRELTSEELSADQFAAILDEAATLMGLPSTHDRNLDNLAKRFSDDVLKIELSGPQHHHLSVVDIPGLFHNPTKFQTQEDLEIIRNLIETYIVDHRTITLAVMDARNNLANQEVFRLARAADPQGKRTVGIITKCDALESGDEDMVLRIAQNAVEKLTHGWFVVKNRSTKDIKDGVTMEQRHKNEHHFFKSAPWDALPRERVGVHALSRFLGQLLYDHIREEFPSLVAEIRSMVLQSREELDQLGPPRQHSVQQRQFLSKLATQYQRAVEDCLHGNYDCSWDAADPRKLRMRLQLENESFGHRLARKGHTRAFRKSDDAADDEFPRQGKDDDIYAWIRQQYRDSRGAELPGTVNPTVLERIFRVQAKSWRSMTGNHVATIHKIVVEFNERLFQEIVSEDSLRGKLEARSARTLQRAKEDALGQMELIIKDEMEGILQTVNHYFVDTLAAARKDRILCRLKNLGLNDDRGQSVLLKDIASATHLSNEDQAVFDIHDILKAYYKVALKRFTDTIVLQVVERHYIGNEGPVRYFSPEHVSSLTDRELTEIADESYVTSTTRNETSAKLERLEKALKIAEQQF